MAFAFRFGVLFPKAAIYSGFDHAEGFRAFHGAWVLRDDPAFIVDGDDLPPMPLMLIGFGQWLALVTEMVALGLTAHQKRALDGSDPDAKLPRGLGQAWEELFDAVSPDGDDSPALPRGALGLDVNRRLSVPPAVAKGAYPMFNGFIDGIPIARAKEKLSFLDRGKLSQVIACLIALDNPPWTIAHRFISHKGPQETPGGLSS